MAESIDEDSFDDSDAEAGVVRKRSRRSSRPYDYKRNFPETAHVQMSIQDGKWFNHVIMTMRNDRKTGARNVLPRVSFFRQCFSERSGGTSPRHSN